MVGERYLARLFASRAEVPGTAEALEAVRSHPPGTLGAVLLEVQTPLVCSDVLEVDQVEEQIRL